MAKNKISAPQGMAGLQRFNDADSGRFRIKPQHVIILLFVVIAIVAFLHVYGETLFNVSVAQMVQSL